MKIKTAKRVQAVCKVGIGVIGIATGTRGASGRASRRGKVGPKGAEKVRASDQLPVNFKRRNGFLVVLGIKICSSMEEPSSKRKNRLSDP